MTSSLDRLYSELTEAQKKFEGGLPPVEKWNPELSGDIDIVINREGEWFHEGSKIQRQSLVKLFASILKEEEGEYFLVTPVEKWRIQVEVAPLVIISAKRSDDGALITMTTNLGNSVVLGDDNPLFLEASGGSELPFVSVQRDLKALVHRNVFYQMVEWGELCSRGDGVQELIVNSMGSRFSLGVIAD